MDGKPVHDQADKQEICSWRVDQTMDSLQVTVQVDRPRKASYSTSDPDEGEGARPAAAFAPDDSDFTVRAALGKVALSVKLDA